MLLQSNTWPFHAHKLPKSPQSASRRSPLMYPKPVSGIASCLPPTRLSDFDHSERVRRQGQSQFSAFQVMLRRWGNLCGVLELLNLCLRKVAR